jgi:predicted dehydrogenase
VNFRRLSVYSGSNKDVDVILDLMIHDTDLVMDLVGSDPVSVTAMGINVYGSAVDYATAHLRFNSGPLITLTASRVTEEKVRSIEVTSMEAYVEASLLNKSVTLHRRTTGQYQNHNSRGVKYHQEGVVESIVVPVVEPLYSELQHFIDSIVEGKPAAVPASAGLKALRLALRIRDACCCENLLKPVNLNAFRQSSLASYPSPIS